MAQKKDANQRNSLKSVETDQRADTAESTKRPITNPPREPDSTLKTPERVKIRHPKSAKGL